MQTQPDQKLVLSLRGDHLEVSRESILALPESILLSLFPNGLALPQTRQLEDGSYVEEDIETYVDFDVACLDFILDFFQQAKVDFYGTPEDPRRPYVDTHDMALQPHVPLPNPLFHKQAIIILREELEYFAIPPKRPSGMSLDDDAHPAVDEEGYANQALTELKKTCGQHLLTRRSIFTALQRNVNRENNVAEQHLIDMLCMSGFGKDDEWGYRALEPNRCCVTSIALVLLKTGITFPPDQNSAPLVNNTQLGTAQKLLLFWRKPARKCWWDSSDVEAVGAPDGTISPLKVWARRIWTLETVLI